uniref:Phospholipid scramblase n=1 Tax=Macrostomum lignano TaxID=282301 RepID=A0A1I8JJI9_9PLAT
SKQQQSSVWSSTALENYELSSGLELLTQVDCLLVHQQIELLEILTNWEARNRYRIKNSAGEQLLYATEESDVCARQCCGPQRSFIMHICDITGAEVLRVSRQLKCFACQPACFCSAGLEPCSHELQVEAPPGTVIARVRQQRSCMQPRYEIQDATGRSVLFIRGPKCICRGPCCTMEQEFKFQLTWTSE